MGEKTAEKPVNLSVWNYGKNPYELKKGPNGERRNFAIGTSIEALDQAEYDWLIKQRGLSTGKQVAPGLHNQVSALLAEKAEKEAEIEDLKKQLEKFHKKRD